MKTENETGKNSGMKPRSNRMKIMLLAATILCAPAIHAKITKDSLTVTPFGNVHLYIPDKAPESITIMISGDAGWKYGVIDFSEHFAEKSSLVVGVDILKYYRELRMRKEDCYHVVSDFVKLATIVEKKYKFPHYREPILMGYSSGATLIFALLAQARPNTFKGGISLGFCPDVELPKEFCRLNGLKEFPMTDKKSFNLNPASKLGNKWIVLQGKLDEVCEFRNTANFVRKTANAELVTLDHVGHGFSKWSNFMPQWDSAYKSILVQPSPTAQKQENKNIPVNIEGLPYTVTEVKNHKGNTPMVLFISGDGGWYSFEQNLCNHLAIAGVPTVGLDAKKYFWNRRTPEESARDITRLLNHFSERWEKNKIMLMGYSMGAEVMPFIYASLSKEMQEKVKKMILLSPDDRGDFEVHISNMLGIGNYQNTYNVVKELRKISPYAPVLIITGEKEDSDLPTVLASTSIDFANVPGDHHYNNDSYAIFNVLKEKGLLDSSLK